MNTTTLPYNVVIIGSGLTGLTAAIYSAIEHIRHEEQTMSRVQPVNPETVTGQSEELLDSVKRKRERIAIAMADAN